MNLVDRLKNSIIAGRVLIGITLAGITGCDMIYSYHSQNADATVEKGNASLVDGNKDEGFVSDYKTSNFDRGKDYLTDTKLDGIESGVDTIIASDTGTNFIDGGPSICSGKWNCHEYATYYCEAGCNGIAINCIPASPGDSFCRCNGKDVWATGHYCDACALAAEKCF